MSNFTPERSEIIRASLISHVAESPSTRRKRTLWTASLVLVGALAGAGVSAGAFAATGLFAAVPAQPSGQPTPDYPDTVAAPPGVTPGYPIISLLGEPISQNVETATEISMQDRPVAATHARVTITPLTPGALNWGTDPGGNNPSGSWSAEDLTAGRDSAVWYDFPLDDTVKDLFLNPSGFRGIVTIQYVTHVPTSLGINANGQTFGVTGSEQGEPELISVIGTAPDGSDIEGYVFATELNATGPDHEGEPETPEEALLWQQERDEKYPNGWAIPLYDSEGETRIGEFRIGG